jgi:hypothetical protein
LHAEAGFESCNDAGDLLAHFVGVCVQLYKITQK